MTNDVAKKLLTGKLSQCGGAVHGVLGTASVTINVRLHTSGALT